MKKKKETSDTFINKLLEETYAIVKNDTYNQRKSNLLSHFQSQSKVNKTFSDPFLQNYFSQKKIETLNLSYLKQIKCFRLSIEDLCLDFPENWSVFQRLKDNYEDKNFVELISSENDEDNLCEVINGYFSNESKLLFIIEDRVTYLAFLEIDDDTTLGWVENYLMSSNYKLSA